MNKKYKKQARVAVAVALATTSVASSVGNVFAQKESEVDVYNATDTEEIEEEQLEELNESLEIKEEISKEAKATGDVAINSTTFPDEAFREYISNNFDSDGDGILSIVELDSVSEINVEGMRAITSLEGIEYFTALGTLYCSSTSITNLDLTKNTRLQSVYCNNTPLTNIDISKNNLFLLEMNNNEELTKIDVSNNRRLRWFHIRNNQISNLDVSMLAELVSFNCGGTQITNLDVSNNVILERLVFDNTLITDVDTSQNPELKYLSCYESSIENLDLSSNTKLETLLCYNTQITNLDVSNNLLLRELNCAFTSITSLEVTNNPSLIELRCNNTQITSLDLNKNSKLEILNCEFTPITNLDVSKTPNLRDLNCNNTGLMGLDVSNNRVLLNFKCLNNQLAWLHIGDHDSIYAVQKSDSVIDLGEIDITFNIQERFPGIDPNRIISIEGAEIDRATGIVSKYNNGVPIRYVYDCGISDRRTEKLNVTLNFTKTLKESTITINSVSNKVYDGQPMADPTSIVKIGSSGDVTFEWFYKDGNGQWVSLGNQAPVNAGEYGVRAHLAADLDYKAADSGEPTPFTITQAPSSISINNYAGKVYDGVAVSDPADITNTGSDGAITFEWFRKTADGAWASLGNQAPIDAGEYGVRAHLAANQNYTVANSGEPTPFEITKATSSIRINRYAGKVYDGVAMSNPTDITNTGSDGVITFEWFRKTADGQWESLGEQAPINVGEYGVKAHLAANQNYAAANSGEPTPFEITQAPSSITINNYNGKAYDGTPVNDPTDITRTQNTATVAFKYYRADDMTEIAAPSEVGAYKVKAFLSGDANYINSESNFVNFNITALSTTITLTYGNQTYTGNPVVAPQKGIHYTVQGSTGTVTIEWYNANDLTTPLAQAPTNVGSYVVKVSVAGTDTHTEASATESFEITPAASTIGINSYDGKMYDGNPVSDPADITTTGSDGAITFEWFRKTEDGQWESLGNQAPVNAGEYGVKAYLAANQNYAAADSGEPKSFEITKAVSTVSINNYEGKVYDGTAISNPADITTTGSDGEVTFEWYRKTAGGNWNSLGEQAPVNAGEYGVKAYLAGNQNYAAANSGEPISFTITKATSSIRINSYDGKIYDGNPVNDPTDITRTQNTATVTFKYYRADDMTEITAPSEVGAYKVKAFLSGDANYIDSESNFVDFNITALSTTITLTYGNQVYTGSPVADPQYIVEGSTGAVTIEWYEASDLTTPLAQAPINVGGYVVKVSVAGTDTHTGASKMVSFEITKAPSTISIHNYAGKVYDGTPISNPTDIRVNGSTGAVTIEWYKEDGTKLEDAPIDVGSYKVKAILANDANYEGAETEQEVIISKAPNAWTTELSMQDWIYGEEANTPEAEAQFGTVAYKYSIVEDGIYTDVIPSDAGTYWVKATVEATDNYEGLEAKVSFTIDKANSSITIDTDLNKEYDGQPVNNPSVTQIGSQSTPVYEWYVKNEEAARADTWTKLAEVPVEVGSYKLVVSVAEDTNYYGAIAEEEFSIKAAQSESIPTPGEDSNVEPESTIEGVQTGDTTQVGLWTTLAGLATGIMLFFTKNKRKEEK